MKPKVRSGAKRSKSAVAPKIKTSDLLDDIRQAVKDSWLNNVRVGFEIGRGAVAVSATIVVNGYRRYTITTNKGLQHALNSLLSIAKNGNAYGPDKHFEA